jgi:iron complex transport system substrate-binding protein
VATALGVPERGEALAQALAYRITNVSERTLRIRPRPRVAAIEWIDPLMAAGNWMPELIALAGGENLFGETGRHSPWLEWSALRAADPDVIVVLPCGFDLARTRSELAPLAAQPGFEALRAVRDGRIYLTDGNQYFNRPGPRLVESLEILAEILHPDAFPAQRRGAGWEPYR